MVGYNQIRDCVLLVAGITSIIITGKLGAGEDTYLLECSTDQIGKVQLASLGGTAGAREYLG
jgi:hypothetical protein